MASNKTNFGFTSENLDVRSHYLFTYSSSVIEKNSKTTASNLHKLVQLQHAAIFGYSNYHARECSISRCHRSAGNSALPVLRGIQTQELRYFTTRALKTVTLGVADKANLEQWYVYLISVAVMTGRGLNTALHEQHS